MQNSLNLTDWQAIFYNCLLTIASFRGALMTYMTGNSLNLGMVTLSFDSIERPSCTNNE